MENINIVSGGRESLGIGIPFGTLSTKPFWSKDPEDLPMPTPDSYTIHIGDTMIHALNTLTWNIGNGKLIQSNLCSKCRLPDIIHSGLIAGKDVTIDGLKFLARIPVLEEDTALCGKFQITRASYWAYSTEQMEQQPFTLMPGEDPASIVIAGPANEYLRLVLTPIRPNLEDLVGKRVRLLLNSCIITAHLQEIDTYDLTCTRVNICNGQISNTYAQWHADLETLYIARDAVVNAGEV